MANPAVMVPPGLLIYSWISFSGSWASKKSSCAVIRLAEVSFTSYPRIIILYASSREYMS